MEQIQLEILNCISTNTQENIRLREIVLYRLLLVLHICQVAVFGSNEACLNSSAYFLSTHYTSVVGDKVGARINRVM